MLHSSTLPTSQPLTAPGRAPHDTDKHEPRPLTCPAQRGSIPLLMRDVKEIRTMTLELMASIFGVDDEKDLAVTLEPNG